MCGADEDWVSAAMTDDNLVVDLLVRLQTAVHPTHRKTLPLDWSVRQRRSRSLSLLSNLKKETHRASPSTPLTWSAATSLSGGSGGGAGGYKEPSAGVGAARSKGGTEKANSKRPRKKKALSELREEETALLKERRELKKEITKQRMLLEKQREINEKLKRMKAQLHDQEPPCLAETCVSYQNQIVSTISIDQTASHSHQERNSFAECHSELMLPDLNIPFEDEAPCPELICGAS